MSVLPRLTDVFRQQSAGPARQHQAHPVTAELTGYSHMRSTTTDICPQVGSDVRGCLRRAAATAAAVAAAAVVEASVMATAVAVVAAVATAAAGALAGAAAAPF